MRQDREVTNEAAQGFRAFSPGYLYSLLIPKLNSQWWRCEGFISQVWCDNRALQKRVECVHLRPWRRSTDVQLNKTFQGCILKHVEWINHVTLSTLCIYTHKICGCPLKATNSEFCWYSLFNREYTETFIWVKQRLAKTINYLFIYLFICETEQFLMYHSAERDSSVEKN